MDWDKIGIEAVTTWLLAASAIGTAAFGVVEVLKRTSLGESGADIVVNALGSPGVDALRRLYGDQYKALVRQAFRGDRAKLGAMLKNGLRLALRDPDAVDGLAKELGQDAKQLKEAVDELTAAAAEGTSEADSASADQFIEFRARVADYELAVDARIEAALAAGSARYAATMRLIAVFVAVIGTVGAHFLLGGTPGNVAKAFVLGVLAVPIAPIANDLVSLLQKAAEFLDRRTGRP